MATYMSLCIAALTPSGIILTADSRQTYRNNAGMTRIGTDTAVKIFQLGKKAGVVIAGRAFFPDSKGVFKNAGWFIEEFRRESVEKLDGVGTKEIAQELSGYLLHHFIEPEEARVKGFIENEVAKEGGTDLVFRPRSRFELSYSFNKQESKVERTFYIETIAFIVAGYDSDGVGRAYYSIVPDLPTEPYSRNTEIGGILRVGQDDVVTRIINGWSSEVVNIPFVQNAQHAGVNVVEELNKASHIISWGVMTLQDAIDFCVLMTRITESVQRFSDGTCMTPGGITGVGGAIDIAKITPEIGFEWIRRKELTVNDD